MNGSKYKSCSMSYGSSLLEVSTSSTYFRARTDSVLMVHSKMILTRNAARWEVTSVSETLEKHIARVQPDPCEVLAGALQNAVLHSDLRSH